jgi:hypothetical protein
LNWILNCERCGRKQAWPGFMYYPVICLEGMKKTGRISERIAGLGDEIWTRVYTDRERDHNLMHMTSIEKSRNKTRARIELYRLLELQMFLVWRWNIWVMELVLVIHLLCKELSFILKSGKRKTVTGSPEYEVGIVTTSPATSAFAVLPTSLPLCFKVQNYFRDKFLFHSFTKFPRFILTFCLQC